MVGPTRWDKGALGSEEFAPIGFDYEGDHRGIAVRRLPGFLRNKTRIQQLTRALLGGVQTFEDLAWGVLEGSILPSAVGDALDRWGNLVGEPRGSLASDVDYRPIINARILANRCTGDIDSVMGVIIAAASPIVCIEHIPLPPAGFQMQVTRGDFMSESRRLRVRRILKDCTPGGRDARYVEIKQGGFAPTASCAGGVFGGPMAREI